MDAAEIFEVTRQGIDFYSRLFDQPFPFTKYDQIFVPEFNAGAMENVGAVTFHDGSCTATRPPTRSASRAPRWCTTSWPTCGSATW